MEATMFTGWVYDLLLPYAGELKGANPLMLRAIAASKKKNDKIDARKIADALRANLLPESYMASSDIRELRRLWRYRNLLVRLATALKNKTGGVLMECGVEYNKKKLHGKRYFNQLLERLTEVPDSLRPMLRLNRTLLEALVKTQKQLVKKLRQEPLISERLERLLSIPGVGPILALTWILEVGDPHRFGSQRRAVSFCGLCSGENSSAGISKRGPLSKQRNKHLQSMLVEAAKLGPRWNPQLAQVHEREVQRGNRNRATLAVARKLVAYLLYVDKSGRPFELREPTAA
jgi:transposase